MLTRKMAILVLGLSTLAAIGMLAWFLFSPSTTNQATIVAGEMLPTPEPESPNESELEFSPSSADAIDATPKAPSQESQDVSSRKVSVTMPDGTEAVFELPTENNVRWMHLKKSPYDSDAEEWAGQAELKSRIWPSISTGMLFLNGRYIPPPYEFSRVGACEFVNGRLFRYASFWQDQVEQMRSAKMEKPYLYMARMIDQNIEGVHKTLNSDGLVGIRYVLFPEAGLTFYVDEIMPKEVSEDTLKWGEILTSDKSVVEKRKLCSVLSKVKATPFSTGGVCFDKWTEDDIRRFEASDTSAFLQQLRRVVDHAVQARAYKTRQKEEQEKKEAEEYERMIRQQEGQNEQDDSNTINPRPGFTYMGRDVNGDPIWRADPPEAKDQTNGNMIFADCHIVDPYRHDRNGNPYFPFKQWMTNGWRATGNTLQNEHPCPWWFNNSGKGPGAAWYKLPWPKKDMTWCFALDLDALLDGHWKVMLHNLSACPLTTEQQQCLDDNFDGDGKPKVRTYPFYQARAIVVVPFNSPLESISGPQLYDLFMSNELPDYLQKIGFPDVHVWYSQTATIPIVDRVVYWTAKRPLNDYRPSERLPKPLEPKKFFRTIAEDRWSIGFILVQPDIADRLRGLRVLPVSRDGSTSAVLPSLDPVIQDEYPLVETLAFFIRDDAPTWSSDVIQHFLSPEFGERVWSEGIITATKSRMYLSQLRLTELKAGKGTRLSVVGDRIGEKVLGNLATEFVRAKDVIQLRYGAVDSDVIAVGQFVADSPRRELLVLGDRPSEKAMEIHGKKWDSLGRDEEGEPDGTGPVEHVLAGRAVAVIVNPANKLDSLTLGQLKAIFGGEVKDWAIVGGTGLEAADQKVAGATIPINLYGLRANNEATAVFEKECLAREKWVGVEAKADTAEAVAAVSMDPQAMAFVDLSAIPGITLMSLSDGFAASGQNVKVLAVTVGTGEGAKAIKPSPENIRNAMYPLSQRLYLYVHPEASETAKDFSKFASTCGGSEETPYADTVKAVMDTYHAHGLIPLADTAIKRMLTDAMSAAEKKAKADEAKAKKK